MYNIVIGGQRWTGLNLTRQDVCQIFTGGITTWNDPRLVSTPGDGVLASVNQRIQPVVRSDQAGESYVLAQYCLAVDRGDWLTFVHYVVGNRSNETQAGWNGDQDLAPNGNVNQAAPIEYWPPLLDGNDNAINRSGASNVVQYVVDPNTGSNSITYVAAVYAKDAGFPMASVQNQAGDFVQPNANSVQLALSYATPNSAGTFNLDFTGPNPAAYFPSTYSYVPGSHPPPTRRPQPGWTRVWPSFCATPSAPARTTPPHCSTRRCPGRWSPSRCTPSTPCPEPLQPVSVESAAPRRR